MRDLIGKRVRIHRFYNDKDLFYEAEVLPGTTETHICIRDKFGETIYFKTDQIENISVIGGKSD